MAEYKCSKHGGWLDRRDGYRCARCDALGQPTKRTRVGRRHVLVHVSFKQILFGIALMLAILWFKGNAIERALRERGYERSANLVHKVCTNIAARKESVETDMEEGAERRRKQVNDTANRLLGPDAP